MKRDNAPNAARGCLRTLALPFARNANFAARWIFPRSRANSCPAPVPLQARHQGWPPLQVPCATQDRARSATGGLATTSCSKRLPRRDGRGVSRAASEPEPHHRGENAFGWAARDKGFPPTFSHRICRCRQPATSEHRRHSRSRLCPWAAFLRDGFRRGPDARQLLARGPLPARHAAMYLRTVSEAIHTVDPRGQLIA